MVMSSIPNPVSVGESFSLTAQVLNQNGTPLHGARPSWASGNPSTATIDQFGRVDVFETGMATITAAYEDLSTSRELVTWGEVAGTITVDGEPAAGISIRLGYPDELDTPEVVTDSLGSYQFLHLQREEYQGVTILGSYIGFDHTKYGFQVTAQQVAVDLGAVTSTDFQGFSIPQCETVHPLIKLEFANNDPIFDDYWRSAVCRWTSIVYDIAFEECLLRTYDGIVVYIEYVDTLEANDNQLAFCNGSPWRAHFRVPQSSIYDSEHWLVPGQVYKSISRRIASAMGIISTIVPEWKAQVVGEDPVLFMGVKANQEFQALGGEGNLEISWNSDWVSWKDAELCGEILSTASRASGSAPISAVTVAAIDDTGIYKVGQDAVEPFLPYDCSAGADAAAVPAPMTVNHLRVPYR